jgi:hypothetical protein
MYYRPEITVVSQIQSVGDFYRSYSAVFRDFGKETLVRIQIVSDIDDNRKQYLIETFFSIFENDDLDVTDVLQTYSDLLFSNIAKNNLILPNYFPHNIDIVGKDPLLNLNKYHEELKTKKLFNVKLELDLDE